MIKLLLVEDSSAHARLLQELLREPVDNKMHAAKAVEPTTETQATTAGTGIDYHIDWVESLEAALGVIKDKHFDLILLDVVLPGIQELEGLESLHAAVPLTPIIMISVVDNERLKMAALKKGAEDFLVKNEISTKAITWSINRALEKYTAKIGKVSQKSLLSSQSILQSLANLKELKQEAAKRFEQEHPKAQTLSEQRDATSGWNDSEEGA